MPLFKTSIRFAHDVTWPSRRKWSNTFYFETSGPDLACAAMLEGWEDWLRGACDSTIFAYEVYATDLAPGTDNYLVVGVPPGDQRGLRAGATGEKYLTKAVATVDLSAVAGRPSRKFWRYGLYEGDVVNGASLLPAVASAVTTAFNSFVLALSPRDPDGQLLTAVRRVRLSTREFGRTAGADLPEPPAVG